jgi:hypothetical protein
MNPEIPCTAFLMFSASSVAEGTGLGTEMEAGPAASTASPGIAQSEKWRKMRFRGGMLWMHSRQEHQQHMTHAYGDLAGASFACFVSLSCSMIFL